MKDKLYKFFSVISEYALYGILFSLAISNGMVESFAGMALLGFAGRKIIKPDFSYLKFWPNILLLAFFLFSAVSLLNSGDYLRISLHALFGKWMQYFGICMIVQDTAYDRKIFKRGIFVFLFGASLAAFSGLSQYFLGIEFLRNKNIATMDAEMRAVTSSFAHYNDFGGYLVVASSFFSALLLSAKMTKIRIYGLFLLIIFSMAAVFLTFSRGSWLAVGVSFIFLAILSGRYFRRLLPILILFMAMFLYPPFLERLLFSFQSGGDADRFRYWLAALKMIKDHPFFGIGVGTFMANFSAYLPNKNVSYAHNCYLQIWAETGIFSLACFMAFVGSLICSGIRKFMVSRDILLLGLLSGFAGFLAHSFFDTNLYSLRLAILFWAWAGMIIARVRP